LGPGRWKRIRIGLVKSVRGGTPKCPGKRGGGEKNNSRKGGGTFTEGHNHITGKKKAEKKEAQRKK